MNTTVSNNLPSLSNEGGLSAYLDQIKKFPMLAAEEEYMLAKNWKTTGNIKSAEKLVTSHLRLVAKIAMGYKGCLLYTSPSPRDKRQSRMPSSA